MFSDVASNTANLIHTSHNRTILLLTAHTHHKWSILFVTAVRASHRRQEVNNVCPRRKDCQSQCSCNSVSRQRKELISVQKELYKSLSLDTAQDGWLVVVGPVDSLADFSWFAARCGGRRAFTMHLQQSAHLNTFTTRVSLSTTNDYTHVQRPFFWDYPGELVPER